MESFRADQDPVALVVVSVSENELGQLFFAIEFHPVIEQKFSSSELKAVRLASNVLVTQVSKSFLRSVGLDQVSIPMVAREVSGPATVRRRVVDKSN